MYLFCEDNDFLEQMTISYADHIKNKANLNDKIFLDVANVFNNIPNLTKTKINNDTYKITAPNFTTQLFKNGSKFKMIFTYFNRPVKKEYGIKLLEVKAIMDLMNDFLRIQQRYNYLLVLHKLCDVQDIRFEILKYLLPEKNKRLSHWQLKKYL